MKHDAVTHAVIVTMRDCAKLVCDACGAWSWPGHPGYHTVHGPNGAGNYTHRREDGQTGVPSETLCAATSIWSRIRFDFGPSEVRL